MKLYFNQSLNEELPVEEDLVTPSLRDDIEKTRYALEIAYAGFDNAVEPDLIDCYIFEINSLLKRYNHLLALSAQQTGLQEEKSSQKSPIRTLVAHVFG